MLAEARTRSIDHLVWIVRDLDAVGRAFEKLGFQVMPLMRHTEIGTSNRIVQLHDNYLEFVSDIDRGPEFLASRFAGRLAAGDGLAMVSLTARDLEREMPVLAARGLETAPILNARRPVTLPDGTETETASSSAYTWNPQSPFLSLFLSVHKRPETIWMPAWQVHENGALGVRGLTYFAARPQASAAYFAAMFDVAPAGRGEGELGFETGRGETVRVLDASRAAARYGDLIAPVGDSAGHGLAIRVAVRDLGVCRDLLRGKAVPFTDTGDLVRVPAGHGAGMVIEFGEGQSGRAA